MSLNAKDEVKSSLANTVLILSHDRAWSGVLGYDERSEEPVLLQRPPFLDCDEATLRAPRPITDRDDVRTAQWLEERHGLTVTLQNVHSAINTVAATHPFDRVRDYLDGLTWDGTRRLSEWTSRYLGTESTRYTRAVGRRWMVSAVARVFEPGCKADHVLVLEGKQGIGKSTALRILAGEEHFGDDIPPVGTKDAQQYLGSLWIVELAEMDAASKAEGSTMKRFLTTDTDRYRPPYGRRMVVHDRRCVFAGSVNLSAYLKDSTGGRRFWPVRCETVDLPALRQSRDDLWAEAVAAYRADESWYLDDPELIGLAEGEQRARLEHDPWHDKIAEYCAHPQRKFVTTAELLADAIQKDLAKTNKADSNRVGAIMRTLGGWHYGEGDDRKRGWRHAERWNAATQPTEITQPTEKTRGDKAP
ncbi:MAG: virulence-associated E family protein [Myxococcota bacterium]